MCQDDYLADLPLSVRHAAGLHTKLTGNETCGGLCPKRRLHGDGGDVGSMMRVERTRWRMDIAQSREARRNWPEGLEVDE